METVIFHFLYWVFRVSSPTDFVTINITRVKAFMAVLRRSRYDVSVCLTNYSYIYPLTRRGTLAWADSCYQILPWTLHQLSEEMLYTALDHKGVAHSIICDQSPSILALKCSRKCRYVEHTDSTRMECSPDVHMCMNVHVYIHRWSPALFLLYKKHV